jgi:hypothetical protein
MYFVCKPASETTTIIAINGRSVIGRQCSLQQAPAAPHKKPDSGLTSPDRFSGDMFHDLGYSVRLSDAHGAQMRDPARPRTPGRRSPTPWLYSSVRTASESHAEHCNTAFSGRIAAQASTRSERAAHWFTRFATLSQPNLRTLE